MSPAAELLAVRLRRLGVDPLRLAPTDLESLASRDAERPMDAATLLREAIPLYQPEAR